MPLLKSEYTLNLENIQYRDLKTKVNLCLLSFFLFVLRLTFR